MAILLLTVVLFYESIRSAKHRHMGELTTALSTLYRSCLPLYYLLSLDTGAVFPYITCLVWTQELSSPRHLQSQDTGAVFHKMLAESEYRSFLPLDT